MFSKKSKSLIEYGILLQKKKKINILKWGGTEKVCPFYRFYLHYKSAKIKMSSHDILSRIRVKLVKALVL